MRRAASRETSGRFRRNHLVTVADLRALTLMAVLGLAGVVHSVGGEVDGHRCIDDEDCHNRTVAQTADGRAANP